MPSKLTLQRLDIRMLSRVAPQMVKAAIEPLLKRSIRLVKKSLRLGAKTREYMDQYLRLSRSIGVKGPRSACRFALKNAARKPGIARSSLVAALGGALSSSRKSRNSNVSRIRFAGSSSIRRFAFCRSSVMLITDSESIRVIGLPRSTPRPGEPIRYRGLLAPTNVL